jgi:ParB-like chromosome segregation protein Spo0J
MKISEIHINPENPRIIKDENFKSLVNSIREFPKMMKLRPIVIDNEKMVLGGDKRYKALKELKYKDIPDDWVKYADDLTEEEKKRFIILDNLNSGSWDWDMLANEWNEELLADWGLEIPDLDKVIKKKEELKDFSRSHVLISYHPDQHLQVQKLLEQLDNIQNIEIEIASN